MLTGCHARFRLSLRYSFQKCRVYCRRSALTPPGSDRRSESTPDRRPWEPCVPRTPRGVVPPRWAGCAQALPRPLAAGRRPARRARRLRGGGERAAASARALSDSQAAAQSPVRSGGGCLVAPTPPFPATRGRRSARAIADTSGTGPAPFPRGDRAAPQPQRRSDRSPAGPRETAAAAGEAARARRSRRTVRPAGNRTVIVSTQTGAPRCSTSAGEPGAG